MNLFQLEYFVVLAETLSYTKASQKLHITQPTLSKLVVNLEHMIGSQLFIRNKRDVKLTPAGKIFYKEIKQTLNSYEHAIQTVREMENGTTGIVNLGFLGTALLKPLPQIINHFRKLYPTVKLNALDYGYSHIMDCLAKGEIDLALIPDLELDTLPNMSKKIVATDEMCVVLPADHKFSGLESIDLSLIKDEPFINIDIKASRRDHNFIINICRDHNFLPNVVNEANTLLNILVMVECNMGISIMARHIEVFAPEALKFVPIKGYTNGFRIACIHNNTNTNAYVNTLLEVIDTCFKSEQ
jgi:DNA-binding transcriptional LysR family regulator